MAKEEKPICSTCGIELSANHMITEYFKYTIADFINKLNFTNTLGPNVHTTDQVLKFLKIFELYSSI